MKAKGRSGAAVADAVDTPGRRPGRSRLATVRTDFFLDPSDRLSEHERALMTAMLHGFVADVAEALRSGIGGAAERCDDHELVARLNRSGLLDEPELMALLLRRAEEERIAAAASARAGRSEARVLQGLVGHEHAAVSAAAMALILARGRRRDRFGQCLLVFDDLAPETAAVLVHRVAAALKLVEGHPDSALLESSGRLIGSHDRDKSLESLAAALAAALAEAAALDSDLLLAAANEGDVSLLAHLLAHLAGVPGAVADAELLSGDADAVIHLLRMAGVKRQVAAGILAAIGDLVGVHEPAEALKLFGSLSDADAAKAHVLVTSDPAYRSAVARMEADRG